MPDMQAFTALADPTRRHIVELLAEREYAAGDLVERFELSQPAVSQHLRVLRDAGLVRVRRDAQRRMYALEPRGLEEMDAWLSRYRRFWSEHLTALERALIAEKDAS
jgi:DNA-binding transcriptional ArsR family regulator